MDLNISLDRRTVAVVLAALVVVGLAGAAFLSNSYTATTGTRYATDSGPVVVLGSDRQVESGNPFVDADTVRLRTDGGNVTVSASQRTTVRLDEINGTWTNTSALDVSNASTLVAPDDKPNVSVEGAASSLDFRAMTIDDGTIDFRYSASGTATLTVNGLAANTEVAAVDPGNTVLDSGTTDASGSVTFTLPSGSHDAYIRTGESPIVDDSSMSPNGTVSSFPQTLEVNVSDPDMPDEELTVSFYIDGNYHASDTLTSNGTASATVSSLTGGNHTWHVEVGDAYGKNATSATAEIDAPGTLYIYDESNPDKLIKNAQVTIRFFADEQTESPLVVERKTSNGKVDMTGLPTTEEFVVTADATDYYERRIYIESLISQQQVYLLNTTKSARLARFQLDDKTGNFRTGNTTLIIERPLNTSGTLNYTTIAGDYFGAANEFKINLRRGARYRLIIENRRGDRRILGTWMAVGTSNPQVLEVGHIIVRPQKADTYRAEGTIVPADTDGDGQKDERKIVWTYSDPSGNTSDLTVRVHERGNASNEIYRDTVASAGNISVTVPLNDSEANKTWTINWSASRNGNQIGNVRPVGKVTVDQPLPSKWLSTLMMVAIPVVAALFSDRIATIGGLVTVIFTGLMILVGWLQIPVALWFVATFIAIGGHARAVAKSTV